MVVLHLITTMDPAKGGVCRAVCNMAKGLHALGVDNEVASLDPDGLEKEAGASFSLHALGPASGPWQRSPKLIPWLLENLPRIDVVILHGLWLYHGYALRKAMRHLRQSRGGSSVPKVLIMPHGMLDPYFQRDPERRLKAIRNRIYWELVERSLVNEADGLLFTCDEERRLAAESFPRYRPRQTFVVGLGVEEPPPFIERMRHQFSSKCPDLGDRKYLLFISRIHPKKGVDLLIKAYAALLKDAGDGLETMPALVIAGPGVETPYGASMLALAAETCPAGTVHWPGMLSGDSKWGAFHGCEAFVLSSHQENFGIAVVEALACGKPAMISRQVNIWKEIEQGGGGISAEDTLQGTTLLLNTWYSSLKAGKDFRASALQCYRNHFDIDNAASRMNRALQETVIQPPALAHSV